MVGTGCSQRRRTDMRKVIVSEFVSLDGVVENPAWTFQFGSEEQEQYTFAELFARDALLLGRVTYQGFATAWPSMQGTGAYGEHMNSMPKYVASTFYAPFGEQKYERTSSLIGSMKGVFNMPELHTLLTGLAFGESPRWHNDRLWFSDFGAQEVWASCPMGTC